ncbi:cell division protein FtsH, partial [Paraburkholderia sp. UYCP14C]
RIGLATLGEPADPMGLPGFEPWRGAPCSDATARLVDEEIRGVLNDAHARVTATLQAQRAPLERIARLLLEREVLDHELLQKAIEGQPVPGTTLDVDQRREAVRDYAEGAVSRCGPS